MSHETDALLLRAGMRAGLIDPDKGTAALVVYAQMKKLGAQFSFGDFLVERKLLSRMALEGLQQNLASGSGAAPRTVSRLGDFELLEILGEGAGGTVFKARQISLDRTVAVKVLSPSLAANAEALQRFLDEARISARIRHPNAVHVIRVAVAEGLYYLAMEYIAGGSLRDLLDAKIGGLRETEALRLGKQIAGALAAAHKAGLVHRDVKPENILLTENGDAKLADLGIAVPADLNGVLGTDGKDGEFWGTPAYVAPEVIEGHGTNDTRSDLYSLGAILFELLTGRTPFVAKSPEELLRMQVMAIAPDVRQLNPGLAPQTAALVRRLLDKDPAQRFPSAETVEESIGVIESLIERGITGEMPAPGTPSYLPRPSSESQRRKSSRRRGFGRPARSRKRRRS